MDLLKWFRRKPPEAPVFMVPAPEPEPVQEQMRVVPYPRVEKSPLLCSKCKGKLTDSYRTYSDGSRRCIPCSVKAHA